MLLFEAQCGWRMEHTFRFCKETLRWTAPRVRQPAQADRWTALVVLAYTQLRLTPGRVRHPPVSVTRSFCSTMA